MVGVFVVGMHRSGTSTVAGALEALGLSTGPEELRLPPDQGNPVGYFELRDVMTLNDEVLCELGGTWDRPPRICAGWASEGRYDSYVRRAAELLPALGSKNFVVKDPRLCLLLPLWRRAVLDRCCAVFVWRDPIEVAWSLHLRDGLSPLVSYTLWAHYNRSALTGLAGLPVHVCRYESLLLDPPRQLGMVVASLRASGEVGGDLDEAAMLGRVQGGLRRATWPRGCPGLRDVPQELVGMAQTLGELEGFHEVLVPPSIGPAFWWERGVLEERRKDGATIRRSEQRLSQALDDNQTLRETLGAREKDLADAVRTLAECRERLEEALGGSDAGLKRGMLQ